MNLDVSLIRGYILPSHHVVATKKLLPRRRETTNTSVKSLVPTITLIEEIRSSRNFSGRKSFPETKILSDREFFSRVNARLDHLIRTRVIDRSRLVSFSTMKNRNSPLENPTRTNLKKSISCSSSVAPTVVVSTNDEQGERDSSEENDAFEEMIEEENLNFVAQAA